MLCRHEPEAGVSESATMHTGQRISDLSLLQAHRYAARTRERHVSAVQAAQAEPGISEASR